MTEAAWQTCTDPQSMLDLLGGKASKRKLLLFVVAGRSLVASEQVKPGFEFAERLADCVAKLDEVGGYYWLRPPENYPFAWVINEYAWPEHPFEWASAFVASSPLDYGVREDQPTRAELVPILRELFGNPFRPVTLDPAWLTWHNGLLESMAQRMYDSRDFSDMPILADALEEAGCSNQDILDHCWSDSEHVRGCWVIDLLLGKS
jgi:hypothetical protein